MSRDTRFKPGQSGNPKGRPKKPRRPHLSAFEIILDKTLIVMRNGQPREATIEEALQQQTLKDALAGKRLAIRQILKMIAKRENALAKKHRPVTKPPKLEMHHTSDNADAAMRILGIADRDPGFPGRIKLHSWATQAALSRPGRKALAAKDVSNIKFFTFEANDLSWPKGREE